MLLLQKNATVNRNLDFVTVCKERHVNVAYQDSDSKFRVDITTGTMMNYPQIRPTLTYGRAISWEWEVQEAFFKLNNIKPHWFAYSSNVYSGLPLIQRDEVDYALRSYLGAYPASKDVAFVPGYKYAPQYFNTRTPQPLSPTMNLFGLFTKG